MTFKEYIKVNNIEKNVKDIYCSNSNLTDLNGIEEFTNLTHLNCYNNDLTQLPSLDKLVNLEYLDCDDNSLTELPNLNKLVNLKYLNCNNNKLPKSFNGLSTEEVKSLARQINRNKKIDELVN